VTFSPHGKWALSASADNAFNLDGSKTLSTRWNNTINRIRKVVFT